MRASACGDTVFLRKESGNDYVPRRVSGRFGFALMTLLVEYGRAGDLYLSPALEYSVCTYLSIATTTYSDLEATYNSVRRVSGKCPLSVSVRFQDSLKLSALVGRGQ